MSSLIITNDKANEFIKKQLDFLLERFKEVDQVSISIGTGKNHFDSTNMEEFLNFSWDPAVENNIDDKLDRYIKNGGKEFFHTGAKGKPEASVYKNFASVYLIHPEMYFELSFMQEFKNDGKSFFKAFTYAQGKIRHQFDFIEMSNDWEEGTKNCGLSFKEALSDPNKFVKERCGKI